MSDISIAVHYDTHSAAIDAVQLEVDIDSEPMLFGTWDVNVRYRGRKLTPVGPWSQICEYNENGCDYLELDLALTHEYRLQRFFLLDHDDRLLLLGDTLLWVADTPPRKPVACNLAYESTLLYSPKLTSQTSTEATEMTFYSGKRPAFRILPLALPEWRRSREHGEDDGMVRGELEIEHDALVYRLESSGVSLFAPLVFDLDAARLKKPYTWRHLTVGENLQKTPEDKAAGFRFQFGKEQFLLYSSMTDQANRTLLGHNLIDDFCFARFDPDTGVDALVEVQQE